MKQIKRFDKPYANRPYKGVYVKHTKSGEKRYHARLWDGQRIINLGVYSTALLASKAYQLKLGVLQ